MSNYPPPPPTHWCRGSNFEAHILAVFHEPLGLATVWCGRGGRRVR